MNPASGATPLPAQRWNLWAIGAAIGLASLLLVVSSVIAYLYIFSMFAEYDDEGYMMLTIQHLRDGRALYDDVPTVYGPFYYLVEWLLHSLCRVPLTNDATRIASIFFWITTSGLVAYCALKMTRRVSLAVLVYALVFFYLRILIEGPGHPQELCGLLLAAGMAVSLWEGRNQRTAAALGLGAVAAALVLTKLNIGVLVTLSMLLATSAAACNDRVRAILRALAAAAAMLLPFVVARAFLSTVWGLSFALVISLSIVPLLIAGCATEENTAKFDYVSFATSFVATAAAAFLFVFAHRSSLAGMIDSLILMPQRLVLPSGAAVPIGPGAVVWSLVSIALATIHTQRVRQGLIPSMPTYRTAYCALKMLFGVWVLSRAWRLEPWSLVKFGTPLLWLCLAPYPASPARASESNLARLILCFVAALQPFQVYPVPGSQSYFGTFLMILVAAVCVGDGLAWIEQSYGNRPLLRLLRHTGLTLVLVLVAALCFRRGSVAAANYRAAAPLGLHGAEWIRIHPRRVATYRWLVANLDAHADTFVCTRGFNSLYFWTGKNPPCPIVIGNTLDIFTERQQQSLVASLAKFPAACVVDHPSFFPALKSARARKNLLLEYIDEEFVTYDRTDGFELKFRKGRPIAPPAARTLARGQPKGTAATRSRRPRPAPGSS